MVPQAISPFPSLWSFNDAFLSVFTTEACASFFGVYLSTVSGKRLWLHHELSYFNPTDGETKSFKKIQDCYEEAGLKAKSQDVQFMVKPFLPPLTHAANIGGLCTNDQCNHYYVSGDQQ
jgi:hypothetical protein